MLKTETNKMKYDWTETAKLINSKEVTCNTLTCSNLSYQKSELVFLVPLH